MTMTNEIFLKGEWLDAVYVDQGDLIAGVLRGDVERPSPFDIGGKGHHKEIDRFAEPKRSLALNLLAEMVKNGGPRWRSPIRGRKSEDGRRSAVIIHEVGHAVVGAHDGIQINSVSAYFKCCG